MPARSWGWCESFVSYEEAVESGGVGVLIVESRRKRIPERLINQNGDGAVVDWSLR
jgi:hypothetical protein